MARWHPRKALLNQNQGTWVSPSSHRLQERQDGAPGQLKIPVMIVDASVRDKSLAVSKLHISVPAEVDRRGPVWSGFFRDKGFLVDIGCSWCEAVSKYLGRVARQPFRRCPSEMRNFRTCRHVRRTGCASKVNKLFDQLTCSQLSWHL